jgi:hypothetical protein
MQSYRVKFEKKFLVFFVVWWLFLSVPPHKYIPPLGPGKISARRRVLAQWRGVDLAPLEMAQAARARSAGDVLSRVMSDLHMDSRRAEAEIVRYRRKEILDRLRHSFGRELIQRISFRIG